MLPDKLLGRRTSPEIPLVCIFCCFLGLCVCVSVGVNVMSGDVEWVSSMQVENHCSRRAIRCVAVDLGKRRVDRP